MQNLDIIAETIAYMESHLKSPLTVAETAEKCGYSLFHFTRLFQGVTGHTPKDYFLRRRLSEAALHLTEREDRILDVALDWGFQNHESFTRAFRRIMGCTPQEFRKVKILDDRILLKPLKVDNLRQIARNRNEDPLEVELPGFTLIGLATYIQEDKSQISELWQAIGRGLKDIPGLKKPWEFYNLAYCGEKVNLEEFFLLCGAEAAEPVLKELPFPWISRRVPAARYLKFRHQGPVDDLHLTYRYIYETWLPLSHQALPLPFDLEYFGKGFSDPDREESQVEILIPVAFL